MPRFLFILLASSCLAAAGQVPDYVPADGLTFFSSLDEESLSQGLQVGSIQPVEDRFGLENKALHFSGGYLTFDDQIPLGSTSRTVSFWFLSDQNENATVVSWGGNDEPCKDFSVWLNRCQTGVGLNVSFDSRTFDTPFSDENWHHVVFAYSGEGGFDNVTFFFDGELVTAECAESPWSCDFETSDTFPLTLGRYHNEAIPVPHFAGVLDEIGIWDRPLGQEEVVALFTGEPTQGCTIEDACNYNEGADLNDGSCLFFPLETLQSLVEVSSSSELQVSVPQGLTSWSWSDGVQDSTRVIQPLQEYVLNGFVGQIPELGEDFDGGVVFAIDTLAQTAFLATSENVGSGAEWGCKTTITGATSTALGTGQTNTQTILDACQELDCAARIAHSVGPDWYLPSRDELEAIRVSLHEEGLASYFIDNTYNWYWSSSECMTDGTAATSIHFSDGFVAECNNKDSNPGGVIAVKNTPIDFCFFTDTLRIELDGGPLCGLGTVWDEVSQTCVVANPSDSNFDGCVQLNDLLALLSAYGNCAAEESVWQCGDPLEYQGYDYETVQIGEQCWFAENLRAESYRNGDMIPSGLTDEHWGQAVSGAKSIYGEGTSQCYYGSCDEVENLFLYGRLYNNYSVQDGRGLCPTGWNVPSDEDWGQMELWLGMSEQDVLEEGWRTYSEDFELKSDSIWPVGAQGSNNVGFNGRPAGARSYDGHFYNGGVSTTYWTNSSLRIVRSLGLGNHGIERGVGEIWQSGFSIRCIKDTE